MCVCVCVCACACACVSVCVCVCVQGVAGWLCPPNQTNLVQMSFSLKCNSKSLELQKNEFQQDKKGSTVNFSTFAKKGTWLLNHSVAASKALLSQVHVHVVQS